MHSNNRRSLEMVPGIYNGKRVPCRGVACDAGAGVLVSRVVRLVPRFLLSSVVVAAKPLLHLRLCVFCSQSRCRMRPSQLPGKHKDDKILLLFLLLLLLLLCSLSPPLTSTCSYKSLRSLDCNNRYTHTKERLSATHQLSSLFSHHHPHFSIIVYNSFSFFFLFFLWQSSCFFLAFVATVTVSE